MSELPTVSAPSAASDDPEMAARVKQDATRIMAAIGPQSPTARALADIEGAKLFAGEDVAEVLDAIGDLIRVVGTPDKVFGWVVELLTRENLATYAAQHRLTLHRSRATEEEQMHRTVVVWTVGGEGMAIIPAGQRAATALLQLREEVAQRAEDQQRAADFQASVAAGHVEDVEAWHARITQAKQ